MKVTKTKNVRSATRLRERYGASDNAALLVMSSVVETSLIGRERSEALSRRRFLDFARNDKYDFVFRG
jgi:hypothetical protein